MALRSILHKGRYWQIFLIVFITGMVISHFLYGDPPSLESSLYAEEERLNNGPSGALKRRDHHRSSAFEYLDDSRLDDSRDPNSGSSGRLVDNSYHGDFSQHEDDANLGVDDDNQGETVVVGAGLYAHFPSEKEKRSRGFSVYDDLFDASVDESESSVNENKEDPLLGDRVESWNIASNSYNEGDIRQGEGQGNSFVYDGMDDNSKQEDLNFDEHDSAFDHTNDDSSDLNQEFETGEAIEVNDEEYFEVVNNFKTYGGDKRQSQVLIEQQEEDGISKGDAVSSIHSHEQDSKMKENQSDGEISSKNEAPNIDVNTDLGKYMNGADDKYVTVSSKPLPDFGGNEIENNNVERETNNLSTNLESLDGSSASDNDPNYNGKELSANDGDRQAATGYDDNKDDMSYLEVDSNPNLEKDFPESVKSMQSGANYVETVDRKDTDIHDLTFGKNGESFKNYNNPTVQPIHRSDVREGGMVHGADAWRVKTGSNKSGYNVTKIILLAYMRSGSSYLGRLMELAPEIFYVFEPLYTTQRLYGVADAFRYLDGHKRNATGETVFIPASDENGGYYGVSSPAVQTTSSMLNCRLCDLDIDTMAQATMAQSRSTRDLSVCARNASYGEADLGKVRRCCVETSKRCSKASTVAAKVIRLTVQQARVLMERDPSVKLIHLMRDPRGMFQSQLWARFLPHEFFSQTVTFCRRILRDVKDHMTLARDFPNRTLLVRYEDVAQSPTEALAYVYKFAGLTPSERIWKYSLRMSTDKNTPYRWRQRIGAKNARIVEQNCGLLLKTFGYRVFPSNVLPEDLSFSTLEQTFAEDWPKGAVVRIS